MSKAIETNSGLTAGVLTNYLKNYSEISVLMQPYLKGDDIVSAMDLCWNSIYWFKNNLVLGPSKRVNDPGE